MKLLHMDEFVLLWYLFRRKETEIELNALEGQSISSLNEETGVQEFLNKLSKKGLIKIELVKIDYKNYDFSDSLLSRYFKLIENKKIKQAKEFTINNYLPTLNIIRNGTKTIPEIYNLINKILKEFNTDKDSTIYLDLTGCISIKFKKTLKFKNYFNAYLEAYKNDELEQPNKEDSENEFYRYKKQKEILVDLLRKKIETQNPKKIIITGKELPLEHLNIYELIFCLEEEKIIINSNDLSDPDRREMKFEFSVDEDKIKQLSVITKTVNIDTKNSIPFLFTEGSKGYLKFYKQGPKILIGNIESRKYKLVKCLISPLGTAKTIDSVFKTIETKKDMFDNRLKDDYSANTRKIELIQYTLKELQKVKGLKGKITLKIYKNNETVALKLYP